MFKAIEGMLISSIVILLLFSLPLCVKGEEGKVASVIVDGTWHQEDEFWYYKDSQGVNQVGWITIDGYRWYFDKEGKLCEAKIKENYYHTLKEAAKDAYSGCTIELTAGYINCYETIRFSNKFNITIQPHREMENASMHKMVILYNYTCKDNERNALPIFDLDGTSLTEVTLKGTDRANLVLDGRGLREKQCETSTLVRSLRNGRLHLYKGVECRNSWHGVFGDLNGEIKIYGGSYHDNLSFGVGSYSNVYIYGGDFFNNIAGAHINGIKGNDPKLNIYGGNFYENTYGVHLEANHNGGKINFIEEGKKEGSKSKISHNRSHGIYATGGEILLNHNSLISENGGHGVYGKGNGNIFIYNGQIAYNGLGKKDLCGVFGEDNTTIHLNGGEILGHKGEGVFSKGYLTSSSRNAKVYQNRYGIRAQLGSSIHGLTIYDNEEVGLILEGTKEHIIYNALIEENPWGLYNLSQTKVRGQLEITSETFSIVQNGDFSIHGLLKIEAPVYLLKNKTLTVEDSSKFLNTVEFYIEEDEVIRNRVLVNYCYNETDQLNNYLLEQTTNQLAISNGLVLGESTENNTFPYQILLNQGFIQLNYHSNFKEKKQSCVVELLEYFPYNPMVSITKEEIFKEELPSKFLGWGITPRIQPWETMLPTKEEINIKELIDLQEKEIKDFTPKELEVTSSIIKDKKALHSFHLFGIYDYAPVIVQETPFSFYEGEELTKKELLTLQKTSDEVDDFLKKKVPIQINSIRLKDSPKAYEKKFSPYMKNEKLTILYAELEKTKEDGELVFDVEFEAIDSVGNSTKQILPFTIKYNEPPKIDGKDMTFFSTELETRAVDENYLKSVVTVSDLEDDLAKEKGMKDKGKEVNIQNSLEILNFNKEQIKQPGEYELNYHVVDRYGKHAYKKIKLTILNPSVKFGSGFIRFINKDYLQVPYEHGGLKNQSKWRKDAECSNFLKDVLQNKKEQKNKTWKKQKYSYEFKSHRIAKVKEFITKNGMGNSKKENSLTEFSQLIK